MRDHSKTPFQIISIGALQAAFRNIVGVLLVSNNPVIRVLCVINSTRLNPIGMPRIPPNGSCCRVTSSALSSCEVPPIRSAGANCVRDQATPE
jgi:hypothetical protein